MTFATQTTAVEERRVAIDGNRVRCWRIGSVSVDRCRECVYLRRLELGPDRSGHVVCVTAAAEDPEFAW